MFSSRSAFISGLGTVNCTGVDPSSLWLRTLRGDTCLQKGLGYLSSESIQLIKESIKNSPYHENMKIFLSDIKANLFYLVTFHAMQQALQDAGWEKLTQKDIIFFGTTTGQIPYWEKSLTSFLKNESSVSQVLPAFRQESLSTSFEYLLKVLEIPSQVILVSTACSASTQALILALLALRQGSVERCLVGGTELFCDLTRAGFKSLQLLSDEPAKPFDVNRNGINLSEGSAFICLEKNPRAPLAELMGGGLMSENYHMTSPHPEGRGYFEAMKRALQDANLQPKQIQWIHAHGTGSPHNDLAEGLAIRRLFGEDGPWVSSSKAIHGHMLGASGVLETILCVQALRNQLIPGTMGIKNPDPKIPIKHLTQSQGGLELLLKNTAGFGGSNASIILRGVPS